MAYLFRVTLRPLLVLLWVFSLLAALLYVSPSHAQQTTFTAPVGSFWLPRSIQTGNLFSSQSDRRPSYDSACSLGLAYARGQYSWATVTLHSANPCAYALNGSVNSAVPGGPTSGQVCPVGTTTIPGTSMSCRCPAGQTVLPSGVCGVDPAQAHCTSVLGSPVKTSWTSTAPSLDTRTVCSSGGYGYYSCHATITPDFCGSSDGVTYLCHGSGTSSGVPCTPSPAPERPVPPTQPVSELPSPPPPGTCPGEVNGVTVNVPCSRTETKGTKTTTENDGAGNTTTKSESKTTSCTAAGSCSTTVTTTTTVNGGTPSTTTKTTEESKGQFCANNPGSKECGDGDGSAFGGSCDAGFKCEGDAVQCATARAVNDNLCKLEEVFEMDAATRGLVDSVLAGTWTDNPRDNPQQINVGTFNQSNPFGTSCPGDVTAQMGAFTLTIPLASMCGWLQIIGNMLVAVSLLGATLFIFRGSSS